MKAQTLKFLALIAAGTVAVAFTNRPAQVYKVNTKESVLAWTGKKVTGQHNGNVTISAGSLTWDGKTVKEGSFDIDLSSITVTDVKDADTNAKLVGHLKGDDFFSVAKFPKATLVITSVTPKDGSYWVKGKLTIKGITNETEFPATIKADGKKLTAEAKILVDRTKYDIKFRSTNFFENLGDKAISNDFELDVKLVAVAPGV